MSEAHPIRATKKLQTRTLEFETCSLNVYKETSEREIKRCCAWEYKEPQN